MVQEKLTKIIIICGPTGVGKTAVAGQIAKKFDGEIVNADSGQVWKGLDVGTAKPDAAARAQIPHHLLDVVNPDEHFDASLFVKLADEAISDISGRGKNIFVVGGTGMYIRMLVHGLCDAPSRNAELRLKFAREIEANGIESLHKRLSEIDPVSAKVVHKNDRTRIIRALEIFEAYGIAASEFYRRHRFNERRYDALKIGLDMPRDALYARIDERVDKMIADGLVDEVRELVEKYGPDCQAFSAVGYKEIVQLFNSENPPSPPFEKGGRKAPWGPRPFTGMGGFIDIIKRNTRRFAKRQLTWFRSDHEIKWHTPSQILAIESEIDTFFQRCKEAETQRCKDAKIFSLLLASLFLCFS